MPFQVENTDWNRHHGQDPCLLGNWVEHRAANETVNSNRNEKGRYVDHKDLIKQQVSGSEDLTNRNISVSQQAAKMVFEKPQTKPSLGKQRALIEAELLKQARNELSAAEEVKAARSWISTFKADFGQPSDELPQDVDPEKLQRYSNPITYWNNQALFLQGNVNTTIPAHALKSQANEANVRFGKRTAFSTPIAHAMDA